MATIKELRWGISLAVAATLGCSSGTPQQSSPACPGSGQLACPMPPSGAQMCTSVAMDNNNCGSCGVVCPTGKTCQSGVCAAPTCAAGTAVCGTGSVCTAILTDKSNCGSCGFTCQGGKACLNGTCSCAPGSQECVTGLCSNLLTDPAHCGNCTTACSGTSNLCANGVCVANCPSGQTKCGNSCVVVTNDNANCGNCGVVCTGAQTCVNSVCTGPTVTGTGGSTSVGQGGTSSIGQGGVNPSSGGANPSNGGTASGGTSSIGGASNKGGTSSVGGAAVGGVATTGGAAALGGAGACPAVAEGVLSDFESGTATLYPQPQITPGTVNGFWYVYKDTQSTPTNCTSSVQVPTAVVNAGVAAATLPTTDTRYSTCNRYALHSSIATCATYSGFGAALSPTTGSDIKNPINFSAYDGISFWMKAGSGAQGPLYLELQSKECVPLTGGGVAVSQATDMYNCHGKLFATLPTTWTQVYVPFGTSGPRSLPAPGAIPATTCAASTFCEAPPLVTSNMLGIQFSLEDPFNTAPTAAANYDVWIDDVALYKGDNGYAPAPSGGGVNAYPQDKTFAGCTKPAGANGKHVQDAFANWKAKFVTGTGAGTRVVSPEIDNGATVSEGIAYGMLIAVYMNDKTLFDGLWGYWKANATAGTLMNWKIPGGTGSATDADEDAAFALLQASKQWPTGGYLAAATTMISDIWTSDIDAASFLPKGGSNYGATSGTGVTNPSYFAPAFYKEFAKVDTNTAHNWENVVSAVYTALNSGIGAAVTSGLVSAWCSSNCTTTSTNIGGPATDLLYQYDSHRTPWRIGLDACWNSEIRAATYLTKIVGFFATASATAGLSALGDIYTTAGALGTGSTNNSMSLIGCAGVGAMSISSAESFRNRAYQFLLEGAYTANPTFRNGVGTTIKPGYTYYNATVGLLTLLTMTGNFYVM